MNDELREQLTELGRQIEAAEADRRRAMEQVKAIVRKHRDDIPLRQVSQLTTLSRTTIYGMLEDR